MSHDENGKPSTRRKFISLLSGTALLGWMFRSNSAEAGTWKKLPLANGTGASGTWGISITGSSVSASKAPLSTTSGTLVAADAGKCVSATAAITIPASVFSAGDIVSIYNNSASNITVTQGASLTLRLVGSATTGNRTLAQRGMATIWFVSATEAVISGGGLT